MATRFPIILNGVRFQVNPTSLTVNKSLRYGELAVQSGVKYQVWYNNPETLTIAGLSAGATAFQELLFLKDNYEATTGPGKVSKMFYKNKLYSGFITEITVTHSTSEHLKFGYEVNFQLLQGEKFRMQDFALQPTGAVGSITTAISGVVNEPIASATKAMDKFLGNI